jgi:ribosome maturation factor RimP
MPLEGRKKFVGVLAGLESGAVLLDTESGRVTLAMNEIESARLVPNI